MDLSRPERNILLKNLNLVQYFLGLPEHAVQNRNILLIIVTNGFEFRVSYFYNNIKWLEHVFCFICFYGEFLYMGE